MTVKPTVMNQITHFAKTEYSVGRYKRFCATTVLTVKNTALLASTVVMPLFVSK